MSFLWRAMGLGGSSIPNFPFQVGSEVDTAVTRTLTWTLKAGTRSEDSLPVTIFELPLAGAGQATIDMGRNVAKRAKTLMLPGMLRCYDSVEYNNTIYVATEECIPLSRILSSTNHNAASSSSSTFGALKEEYYEDPEKFNEGVALGLRHVAQALVALHGNQLVHGNVCHESIYVTRSGEWRLFGVELVAGHNEESGLFQRYWSLLPDYRRPPETLTSGGTSVNSPLIHNVDAWGLGALIYAVYSTSPLDALSAVKGSDMRACRSVPRSLQSAFTGLTGANPKLRMSLQKFLTDCEFVVGSEYVQALQQLDELALKDATDRDAVYRKLCSVLDSFPIRACKFIILTKLSVAVQYGGGSATALEPILKIGARLTDPAVFAELVAPIVMTLFASTDAMVRIRLLTSAGQYARLLPAALVNDKIWPHFCSGFSSTNANLRELTIRALVHFAPLLSEKNFSADVIRFITQLQQDREGPIRTNATICLCLIAEHIPQASRAKALVHGFGRMLKDPFLPSRLAALRSLHTTMNHYPPNIVSEMIIPGVAPLTTDATSLEVRAVVFKILDASIDLLKKHSAEMPPPPPEAEGTAASGTTAGTTASPSPASPIPKSASTSSGLWGWGSGSASNNSIAAGNGSAPGLQPAATATSADNAKPHGASTGMPSSSGSATWKEDKEKEQSASGNASWEDALDEELSASNQAPAVSTAAVSKPSGAGGMKLGTIGTKKKGFGGAASKVE